MNVIVCDDQEIVREGLSTILNADPEIKVVATATDGEDLLGKIDQFQTALILMDLKMPIMDGVVATRQIRQRYPAIKVLVLTTYDDEEWIMAAVRAGADGYLLKDTPSDKLCSAIKDTVSGKMHLDPSIAGKVVQHLGEQNPAVEKQDFDLTDREAEILELMAQGLTNADIARTLFLSEGTVRNYTSHLFSKLGVNDRTQAVIAALRYGLVDLNAL